jgi:glycosyltransferase involved in cell wall biosynthesis
LRILTFLHSFEPGGVERVALRLHAAWVADGIDAHVVMGRTDGAMRREWPGFTPEVFPGIGIPTASWETLWMIARLPAAIRRHRPDILFCAGNSYTVVAVAMKLLLGKRCPPVIAKISNDLYRNDLPAIARPFYRLWLRIQGRMLDRVVGMAPPMRAELRELMRVPDEWIVIVDDPSLDMADIARLEMAQSARGSSPRKGRRFLAIGRLAAQKNFALLLESFARIAKADDRLVIVGEGGQRKALEAQAVRLGITDKFELPGHVNPLDAELIAADALVMSSDYEGVPAVVAEALAAGLPIVATRCSVSMDDMLGQGRFGLLVPPRDAVALADAMERVGDLNLDWAAARDQARRFTVQIAADAYLAAMETLVRG